MCKLCARCCHSGRLGKHIEPATCGKSAMSREPDDIQQRRRALGQQLATFRQAAELTQAQLAKRTYFDRSRIAHLERGTGRADQRFWTTADEAVGANGALVAAYAELETAKQTLATKERARELAVIRARADRLRAVGPTVSAASAPENGARDDATTTSRVSAESDLERDDMRRRVLLQGLIAGTGAALSAATLGNLTQIEHIRRELDRLLEGSDGAATIERWEEALSDYGQRFLAVAPGRLLSEAASDFVELQHLLGRQQSTKHRIALARVSGQLAVLAGGCLHAMGEHRNAQAWFHTAGLAAREAQDRQLLGFALGRSAMDCLFHGAYERALANLTKAQAFLGQNATPWRAHAFVVQARVLAMLGRNRDAQRCLADGEAVFNGMPASALADPAFGYTERQFHFSVGNAYTRLGLTHDADAMQRRALDMYQPTEYRDRAFVQLDQAQCMVRLGDVRSACEHAVRHITGVPAEHQGLVSHLAREFLGQLPEASRNEPSVRELRELLLR
jgi:transcriptional regulator with XRE-family HTH domain